ncbi:MAG: hypothetical protein LBU65_06150 [Planctomycetaceae bacterium]|nr:hypothetical protein [Planctomycetaceae bacterium]
MFESSFAPSLNVDDILRNVELRNELEPYFDEAVTRINFRHQPLRHENEFLAAMLAWETAPILPIYRWFEPELRLPQPNALSDEQVSTILNDVIDKLYEKRIVLDFTDHLSDRELYVLIIRDILPLRDKCIDSRNSFMHWDCSYNDGNTDIWLAYYASDEDRQYWEDTFHQPVPPRMIPPHQRNMPQHPL